MWPRPGCCSVLPQSLLGMGEGRKGLCPGGEGVPSGRENMAGAAICIHAFM